MDLPHTQIKLDGKTAQAIARHESKEYRRRDMRRFGNKTFIPMPGEKKDKVDEYFKLYSDIMKPVFDSMEHSKTKEEAQAHITRKLMPWVSSFNQCLYDARTNSDAHECSDRLVGKLGTEGLEFVKKIASEY